MFDITKVTRLVTGNAQHAKGPPGNMVWHTENAGDGKNLVIANTSVVGINADPAIPTPLGKVIQWQGRKAFHVQGDRLDSITFENCSAVDVSFPPGQQIHADGMYINGSVDPARPTSFQALNCLLSNLASGVMPFFFGNSRFFSRIIIDGLRMVDCKSPIQMGTITCPNIIFQNCVGLRAVIAPPPGHIKMVQVFNSPGCSVTVGDYAPGKRTTDVAITLDAASKGGAVAAPVTPPVANQWNDVRALSVIRGPGIPFGDYVSDANGKTILTIEAGTDGAGTYRFKKL